MNSGRARPLILVVVFLSLGMVGPAVASPAPVSGCPPCSEGFVNSATAHGLETEVQRGTATVRVHTNGSASWTVRVVPTNETVLSRLAANQSLARAVAADSFGTRYGTGIDHDLRSVTITDGAVVMQYRTLDVVQTGPLGTQILTYFRDSPGAYVYTDLGADELTVVAPPGMTVANGFGDVTGDRLTATELPDVRDGPFVVFASKGSPAPGLLGLLAIASALWGVVVRNALYFVALPGGVLIGGFAGIRRVFDATTNHDPTRLGWLVAAGGAVLLGGTVIWEGDLLPAVTGNLLFGVFGGMVLCVLGGSVAVSQVRRHLTGLRLVGGGIAAGIVASFVTDGIMGASGVYRLLLLAVAIPPIAVGLGWVDAQDAVGESYFSPWLFAGLSVAIIGALVVSAPLTALGGTLFLLAPILMTVAALGAVIVAIPLYLLGVAGAATARTHSDYCESLPP